jgi:uncharacterized membrane protein YdjX (TVP38/TMEM64 family)
MRVRQWIKKHRTPLIAVLFWVVILVLGSQYMAANNLTFNDFAQQFSTLLRESALGPLLYIGIYLLRPLTLFPASILTLLGGSIFGLFPGFWYVLIAGTLSSVIPYAVGRWFASGENPQAPTDSRLQHFVEMMRRNPFQAVLLTRLLFLPYDAVSLIAGGLRIPFWAFLLATAVGNISGTFSYVGVGASVQGDFSTGEVSFNPQTLAVSVVILIISIVVSRLLNRYQQRRAAVESEVIS